MELNFCQPNWKSSWAYERSSVWIPYQGSDSHYHNYLCFRMISQAMNFVHIRKFLLEKRKNLFFVMGRIRGGKNKYKYEEHVWVIPGCMQEITTHQKFLEHLYLNVREEADLVSIPPISFTIKKGNGGKRTILNIKDNKRIEFWQRKTTYGKQETIFRQTFTSKIAKNGYLSIPFHERRNCEAAVKVAEYLRKNFNHLDWDKPIKNQINYEPRSRRKLQKTSSASLEEHRAQENGSARQESESQSCPSDLFSMPWCSGGSLTSQKTETKHREKITWKI